MSTEIRFSTSHSTQLVDLPMVDVDADPIFASLFAKARPYSMTGKDAMFALYQAARYVALRDIPGDFVECGVWKGGSALLAGLALSYFTTRRLRRRLWLYDTFTGMTPPTERDVDIEGVMAQSYLDRYADDGGWCYASIDSVGDVLRSNGIAMDEVQLVAGDVAQTSVQTVPEAISILRLDTDWYESTRAELEAFFPRLSPGGVLIVDDYGHWAGARQAVDEYFADRPPILLNRINYSVRMGIKL